MRIAALALIGAFGLLATATTSGAAPLAPAALPQASNIVPVSGGCGRGFHRDPWARCIPNRYGYYAPYAYGRPYQPAYPYYGDGHEPWNRPSPTDHVARQLNRQQLMYGY